MFQEWRPRREERQSLVRVRGDSAWTFNPPDLPWWIPLQVPDDPPGQGGLPEIWALPGNP